MSKITSDFLCTPFEQSPGTTTPANMLKEISIYFRPPRNTASLHCRKTDVISQFGYLNKRAKTSNLLRTESLSFARLVSVPPKIQPLQSMTNLLREGMRAPISCQILEGDLPITFKWLRNGKPLPLGGGTQTRRIDEFSVSLVIEKVNSRHSGNYTCVASNVAGEESFTVPLTVNGEFCWKDFGK